MTTETIEFRPSTRHRRAIVWDPPDRLSLDRSSLIAAYREHHGAASRLAYRILGDSADAEDAVHDAFIKLWTASAPFDPSRGSVRGLLLTIARHTSIDVTRKRARRLRTESAYCTDATYVTDGPEHDSERAEDAHRLKDALLALPDEQRRAIELAYFGGLTRSQIAAETAISVGTVKSRMRLGMRKLAFSLSGSRDAPGRSPPRRSATSCL